MQIYSAAAARQIVGLSQRCLDYWDERGIVKPSVVSASGRGSERRYSFDDLHRLALVKRLRAAGISLQKIRKALDTLKKRWPTKKGLSEEILVTDGVSLYTRAKRGQLKDILRGGQLLLSVIAVGELRDDVRQTAAQLDLLILPRRGVRQRGQRKAK
jgi:DNA-binding transcriptional MerR regulator